MLSLSSLNELVRKFDTEFVCLQTSDGVYRVYHNKRVMRSYDIFGSTYFFEHQEPYHVFSLTDTWAYNGSPRDWGYLPIYEKLQMIKDQDRLFQELQSREAKEGEREDRALHNLVESMAYEMRDAVKKDTGDTLTHSLDRTKDKRRDYEKFYKRSS